MLLFNDPSDFLPSVFSYTYLERSGIMSDMR